MLLKCVHILYYDIITQSENQFNKWAAKSCKLSGAPLMTTAHPDSCSRTEQWSGHFRGHADLIFTTVRVRSFSVFFGFFSPCVSIRHHECTGNHGTVERSPLLQPESYSGYFLSFDILQNYLERSKSWCCKEKGAKMCFPPRSHASISTIPARVC